MKEYVEPKVSYILLSASDVITASSTVEFDVTDWLGGGLDS